MQILLLYLFLFIVGCFIGWALEVIFRRFFTAKKWVNPGFMKGPWLPLYGFGSIAMFTICFVVVGLFPDSLKFYNPSGGLFGKDYVSGPAISDLIPISLMWISMNAIEFVAGLIFIKGFRVKLWDYSNMKGNILGIVCPLFSLLWLFVAVVFYYGIDPYMFLLSTNVYEYMFGGNGHVAHFGFIFALGLTYGLMIYDFITSIGVFSSISKFAKSIGVIDRYENLKEKLDSNLKNVRMRFSSQNDFIESNADNIKKKIDKVIYIDPEKNANENNYDKNGRPIKTK